MRLVPGSQRPGQPATFRSACAAVTRTQPVPGRTRFARNKADEAYPNTPTAEDPRTPAPPDGVARPPRPADYNVSLHRNSTGTGSTLLTNTPRRKPAAEPVDPPHRELFTLRAARWRTGTAVACSGRSRAPLAFSQSGIRRIPCLIRFSNWALARPTKHDRAGLGAGQARGRSKEEGPRGSCERLPPTIPPGSDGLSDSVAQKSTGTGLAPVPSADSPTAIPLSPGLMLHCRLMKRMRRHAVPPLVPAHEVGDTPRSAMLLCGSTMCSGPSPSCTASPGPFSKAPRQG